MNVAPVSHSAELAFGAAESEMFMIQSQSVFVDVPVRGGFNVSLITFFRKRESKFHIAKFLPCEKQTGPGTPEARISAEGP